jgi:radical S-adenosyl methionine domain-containing protein 2
MKQRIPPAVNFHLWKPCNLRCKFCYAVFDDDGLLRKVRGGVPEGEARKILDALRLAGVEKLTFVGGEPTLCPYLPQLLRHARELGFVNTIVTNGARLKKVLDSAPGCIDWVGISVDSANEAIQAELGRGDGDHVARTIEHVQMLRQARIRLKLNTVVTALNWREDMTEFVRCVAPERWKVFQVLPVAGQNDDRVAELLITKEQFDHFLAKHRAVASDSLSVAFESNDDMTGSYAMIDPLGRFFSNVGGRHSYSPRILDVGLQAAFESITFDAERFKSRGGIYAWGETPVGVSVPVGVCNLRNGL